jgi:hypothetical protein
VPQRAHHLVDQLVQAARLLQSWRICKAAALFVAALCSTGLGAAEERVLVDHARQPSVQGGVLEVVPTHSRLDTLTTDDRIALLRDEAGVDWLKYPVWARQGQVVRRVPQASVTQFIDQRSGTAHTREVVRRPWESCDAPEFKVAPGLWLDSFIPSAPDTR